jgi:hypothetical protein
LIIIPGLVDFDQNQIAVLLARGGAYDPSQGFIGPASENFMAILYIFSGVLL